MSQLPDDISLFFRYTIPGTISVAWIIAATPISFLHAVTISSPGASEILIAFLASMVLVGGWIAYSGFYPLWLAILRRGHVINILRCHQKALEAIKAAGAFGVAPKSVWSYFLWNECKEPIRNRIKTLANYAHSSFMAASGLIIYPIIYFSLRSAISYVSVLDESSVLLSASLGISGVLLEIFVLLGSTVAGIVIIAEGRRRWIESDAVQLIAYSQNPDRLREIAKTLAG
jgi:hypothetical protein